MIHIAQQYRINVILVFDIPEAIKNKRPPIPSHISASIPLCSILLSISKTTKRTLAIYTKIAFRIAEAEKELLSIVRACSIIASVTSGITSSLIELSGIGTFGAGVFDMLFMMLSIRPPPDKERPPDIVGSLLLSIFISVSDPPTRYIE